MPVFVLLLWGGLFLASLQPWEEEIRRNSLKTHSAIGRGYNKWQCTTARKTKDVRSPQNISSSWPADWLPRPGPKQTHQVLGTSPGAKCRPAAQTSRPSGTRLWDLRWTSMQFRPRKRWHYICPLLYRGRRHTKLKKLPRQENMLRQSPKTAAPRHPQRKILM